MRWFTHGLELTIQVFGGQQESVLNCPGKRVTSRSFMLRRFLTSGVETMCTVPYIVEVQAFPEVSEFDYCKSENFCKV